MLLPVLLVTFAVLAVCLQTCKAHLITLLWSLEEQPTFELILNCSLVSANGCKALCGCTADLYLFHTFHFGLLLLLRVEEASLSTGEGCWRGMSSVQRLPHSIPADETEHREKHSGEEQCFEEPAVKMKPFEGCSV